MDIEFVHGMMSECSNDFLASLRQMTNPVLPGLYSEMQNIIDNYRDYHSIIRYCLARQADRNLGWTLIRPMVYESSDTRDLVMVFVKPECRRQRLGKQLVETIISKHPKDRRVVCWPWNDSSRSFFRAMQIPDKWEF